MSTVPKGQRLLDEIAEALWQVNAKLLPAICVRYGLEPGGVDEAMMSKRSYVKRRIATYSTKQLTELARAILDDYDHEPLEQLLSETWTGGVRGEFRNLIFGAMGEKPDIVLRDAITNEIQVFTKRENCLVYDRPLKRTGLSWEEAIAWWADANGLPANLETARALHRRLRACLDSDPEIVLFDVYARLYRTHGFQLPALIPQIHLHYDPHVRRQFLTDGRRLTRQRMDFLLLLPERKWIVIEIDGKQHYAVGDRANPRLYEEMMAEDRRLRLAGYEVFASAATHSPDRTSRTY
jgi:hypothetical protein